MNTKRYNRLILMVVPLILLSCSTVAQQRPSTAVNDDQQIGKRFEVTMADLPKPYASEAVRNSPLSVARQGKMPKLPEGFTATLFAENLEHPRQVLILPNGDVMAVCQNPGYLMMMHDDDDDGQADWIEKHAGGFNRPYGIAHREGELLVTDQDGIWAINYTDGSLRPPYPLSQKASEVPKDKRVPSPNMDGQRMISKKGIFGLAQGHNNRDIAVAPDGQLFVGVGSSGNIGEEPEPKATIQVFNASASNQQTYASGMRNACGLAVHPTTGDLWAIVQERDGFGDQLVPDFFTKVQKGGFYGFPYSYIGSHPQPGFAEKAPEKVEASIVPDFLFEPHSAAMDAVFYQGENFPSDYQGDAFVALHGSWNRADPTGYKVVRVKFENGRPAQWYDNFMTGFWTQGDDKAVVWGRPADVAVAPDGALFVVDDVGGTIWRVTYAGE